MANIEINEALWNSVSDTDKAQITENLKKNRLLRDGDSITGNPSIPDSTPEGLGGIFPRNIREPACKAACDVAAVAAISAISLEGPALAVALVAIEAARQSCRDGC